MNTGMISSAWKSSERHHWHTPMRPNPLMATLSFFAWVICFDPLVPWCNQDKKLKTSSYLVLTAALCLVSALSSP